MSRKVLDVRRVTSTKIWGVLAYHSPVWLDNALYYPADWWCRRVLGTPYIERIHKRCGQPRFMHAFGRIGECDD